MTHTAILHMVVYIAIRLPNPLGILQGVTKGAHQRVRISNEFISNEIIYS